MKKLPLLLCLCLGIFLFAGNKNLRSENNLTLLSDTSNVRTNVTSSFGSDGETILFLSTTSTNSVTNNEVIFSSSSGILEYGNNIEMCSSTNNQNAVLSHNILVMSNGAAVSFNDPGGSPARNFSTDLGTTNGSNNLVVVVDGGMLNNLDSIFIGVESPSNDLECYTNSSVQCGTFIIGSNSGANYNNALFEGSGAYLSATSELIIGDSGAANTLVISNGATATSPITTFGLYTYENEGVVSGNGSTLNAGVLTVGSNADSISGYGNNKLTISDGATLISTNGRAVIGGNPNGYSNTVAINSNSSWNIGTNNSIFVGYQSNSGNTLLITTNSSVTNGACYIGFDGANSNTISLNGTSSLSISGVLLVGSNGSNNQLIVSDSSTVTVSSNGYIGYGANSTNNSVTVSGTNSTWTVGTLYMGYTSNAVNSGLTISNGATATCSSLTVGNNDVGTGGNSILVAGSNSVFNAGDFIYLGQSNSGNSMVISNGAVVTNGSAIIGNEGANLNTVLVTGTGSLWNMTNGTLQIGYIGIEDTLTISNGGTVISSNNIIGNTGTGADNQVIVTGTNSFWNASILWIGNDDASNNSLIISNGATVTTATCYVGNASAANSNYIVVSGSQALWNVDDLYLGNFGSNNSLAIGNGGKVKVSENLFMGCHSGANIANIYVAGSNSELTVASKLIVGMSNAANLLVVSNGASVSSGYGMVGYSQGPDGSGEVLVTSNATWSAGQLYVAPFDVAACSVTVSNSSTLKSSLCTIGFATNSSAANFVTVTGNSYWTNASMQPLYIGFGGVGTVTIADGSSLSSGSKIWLAAQSGSTGTLNIGSGSDGVGAFYAPSIVFGSGTSELNFNQTNTVTFLGSISGQNAVINQVGSGVTILNGATNHYSGTTTISNGELQVKSTTLGVGSMLLGGTTNYATLSASGTLVASGLSWMTNGVIGLTVGEDSLTIGAMTNSASGGGVFSFSGSSLNNETNLLIAFASQSGFTTNSFSVINLTGYTFVLTSTNVSAYLPTNAAVVSAEDLTITNSVTVSSLEIGGRQTTIASNGSVTAPNGIAIVKGELAVNGGTLGAAVITLGGGSDPATLSIDGNLGITNLSWKTNGIIALIPGREVVGISGEMTNDDGGKFDFSGFSLNNNTNLLLTFGTQIGFTSNSFSVLNASGYSFLLTSTNLSSYLPTNGNVTNASSMILTNVVTLSSLTISNGTTNYVATNGALTATSIYIQTNSLLINNGTITASIFLNGGLFTNGSNGVFNGTITTN